MPVDDEGLRPSLFLVLEAEVGGVRLTISFQKRHERQRSGCGSAQKKSPKPPIVASVSENSSECGNPNKADGNVSVLQRLVKTRLKKKGSQQLPFSVAFRLMVHESLADDVLMNLRCDNEATILRCWTIQVGGRDI